MEVYKKERKKRKEKEKRKRKKKKKKEKERKEIKNKKGSINMLKLIGKLICIIIIAIGVICIYDARSITNKFFSFGDQNEGANGLKIIGFIISSISAIILMIL